MSFNNNEKTPLLFSLIIPTYNGEKFLDNSIHSIVNESIEKKGLTKYYEIIIVNDGSKDNTSKKAHQIARMWNKKLNNKKFIKVIDKENGNYGSVINCAIQKANGKYIKVLDVDDTFNTYSWIDIIYLVIGNKLDVDVIMTDYIFDKVASNNQICLSWKKYFEPYKVLQIQDLNLPKVIITMHSIIYRTELLKKINYKQIEGIYYSDSQYSVVPFSYAKTLFYLNVPLYRYYIGRSEQTINLSVMVKNRSHQLQVMNKFFDELQTIKFNSKVQEEYAWRIARNMFQWQAMLIANDNLVKNKNKTIYNLTLEMIEKCTSSNVGIRLFKNSSFVQIILFTKGLAISQLIKFGAKLYARFKLNIMSEWE